MDLTGCGPLPRRSVWCPRCHSVFAAFSARAMVAALPACRSSCEICVAAIVWLHDGLMWPEGVLCCCHDRRVPPPVGGGILFGRSHVVRGPGWKQSSRSSFNQASRVSLVLAQRLLWEGGCSSTLGFVLLTVGALSVEQPGATGVLPVRMTVWCSVREVRFHGGARDRQGELG